MLLSNKHFGETVKLDFYLILKYTELKEEKGKAPGGGIVWVPPFLAKDPSSSLSSVFCELFPWEEAMHQNQITVVSSFTVYSGCFL